MIILSSKLAYMTIAQGRQTCREFSGVKSYFSHPLSSLPRLVPLFLHSNAVVSFQLAAVTTSECMLHFTLVRRSMLRKIDRPYSTQLDCCDSLLHATTLTPTTSLAKFHWSKERSSWTVCGFSSIDIHDRSNVCVDSFSIGR